MSGLSEEQRRRMEENRQKALARRAAKLSPQKQPAVPNSNTRPYVPPVASSVPQPKLTSTQALIEEKRQKALALRASKMSPQKKPPSTSGPPETIAQTNNDNTARPPQPLSTGYPDSLCNNKQSSSSTFQNASSSSSFYSKNTSKPTVPNPTLTKPTTSAMNSLFTSTKSSSVSNNPSKPGLYTSEQAAQMASNSPPKKKVANPMTGTCVLISRERFEVQVGYHGGLIQMFKSLETKQYDVETKRWSFHLREYHEFMRRLKEIDDVVLGSLPRLVLQCFAEQIKGNVSFRIIPDADLSGVDDVLRDTLMPFQREGINFAIWRRGRVLIADDMGLGKTLQAICIACYYRQEWPILIVVPSSVRFSWRDQILKWVPSLDPQEINVVVTGKDSCTSGLVNIISYDLMNRQAKVLLQKGFEFVIMDESHNLKNIKTARTAAALPILKQARRVILLSGTPALSRPNELFAQVSAVDPRNFPKFHDFGVRYCEGKKMPWGWDYSGSSNLQELQIILEERVMIRRLKKDVITQLPSKLRQMVVLDPSSVKVSKVMKTSHKLVDQMKGMERRGALLEYFHETGSAKVAAVRDYVLDLIDSDHKFLLFAHHQEVMDTLEEAINQKCRSIRIDGRTGTEQRNYLCNKFQNNPDVRVAILSITAANAGLNLTAAALVVFAELFWNPGILVQAEDRAHRIGQEDSVMVQYLVATGTADDYVWPLVQKKLEVLSKAGLSKDNFSDSDTTHVQRQDRQYRDIMSYFEQSFLEEELPEDWDEPDHSTGGAVKRTNAPAQQTLFSVFKPPNKENNNNRLPQQQSETDRVAQEVIPDLLDEIWEEEDPDAPWPKKPRLA